MMNGELGVISPVVKVIVIKFRAFTALSTVSLMKNSVVSSAYICISAILAAAETLFIT